MYECACVCLCLCENSSPIKAYRLLYIKWWRMNERDSDKFNGLLVGPAAAAVMNQKHNF